MAYAIEISRPALKALKKIESLAARRIVAAIDGLAANPRPHGSVKLEGRDAWRLRVGDYRILYEIHDARLRVLVIAVGHRREIYRR